MRAVTRRQVLPVGSGSCFITVVQAHARLRRGIDIGGDTKG